MLVSHKDQESREMCELVLTRVTKSLFGYLENVSKYSEEEVTQLQSTLEKVVRFALEMMPHEC